MHWVGHVWDEASAFLATAGSFLAALGVGKLMLDWWRRGPGRRRRWWSLFQRIALQATADYVIGLFGEPVYRQSREGWRFKTGGEPDKAEKEVVKFTERVWLLANDGYLQILTNDLDNVVRYSLTTRSRGFHPRVPIGAAPGNLPMFFIRLGKTAFSEIPCEPDRVYRGPYGATAPYEYRQSYYHGRSGGYADWTCTFNAAGIAPVEPLPTSIPVPPWEHALSARGWLATLDDAQRNSLNLSRAGTIVNTITIEESQSDRSGMVGYGPGRELVRLMQYNVAWWRISASTRQRTRRVTSKRSSIR
jgi:hypothetical protein